MADDKNKPAPSATSAATTNAAKSAGEPTNATNSNDFPGPDFVQREVRPEDLPASAKVPSPQSQVNTSGVSSIGTSGPAVIDSADEAIADGVEAYKDKNAEIVDGANKLADAHRKLDEDAAKA